MPRSLKKGPFVASHVFERVEQMNASGKKDIIKTWSRSTTILTKYDWAYVCCLQWTATSSSICI